MASIGRTLGKRESKSSAPNEIRFAGDERKNKLYEPKHRQRLIRVLTVVAYVIVVSSVAILLSLYYTFIWNPKEQIRKMRVDKPECAKPPSLDSLPTTPISNGKRRWHVKGRHECFLPLKMMKMFCAKGLISKGLIRINLQIYEPSLKIPR